jgi:ribose 5-phosphate isomerase A
VVGTPVARVGNLDNRDPLGLETNRMTTLPSVSRLAETAIAMVEDGFVVGLGSGHAAAAFVKALAERVQHGLRIRGVPTSKATGELAASLGIPVVGFDEVEAIDVTFDGADEVDPALNLIKGLGGAMVREKIVASASRRLVILVGEEKLVSTLGEHGVLPVEVVPFALAVCQRRIARLGYPAEPRKAGGEPLVTDNGNRVLDCRVPLLVNPQEVEQSLRAIPGIVGTGLFLGMAHTVLVMKGDCVEILKRKEPSSCNSE